MDYKNMILLNQLYQYFKNNSLNFNGKEKEEQMNIIFVSKIIKNLQLLNNQKMIINLKIKLIKY